MTIKIESFMKLRDKEKLLILREVAKGKIKIVEG